MNTYIYDLYLDEKYGVIPEEDVVTLLRLCQEMYGIWPEENTDALIQYLVRHGGKVFRHGALEEYHRRALTSMDPP